MNRILHTYNTIIVFELSKKETGQSLHNLICNMMQKRSPTHSPISKCRYKKAIYSIQKELADITDSRFFMEWSIYRKYTFQIAKKVSINYL